MVIHYVRCRIFPKATYCRRIIRSTSHHRGVLCNAVKRALIVEPIFISAQKPAPNTRRLKASFKKQDHDRSKIINRHGRVRSWFGAPNPFSDRS